MTDSQDKAFILALTGLASAIAAASSGGCTLASGENPAVDPTMWLLVCLAIAALIYRQRRRAAQKRNGRTA